MKCSVNASMDEDPFHFMTKTPSVNVALHLRGLGIENLFQF